MSETIAKIYSLAFNDIKSLIVLLFLFISLSFLDLLGLGIIINFLTIIVNQETNNLIFYDFTKFFFKGFEIERNLMIYSFAIIFVFILKNILSIYFNYFVLNFSLDVAKSYRTKMIKKIFLIPLQTVNKLSNAEVIKIFGENIANFESAIQSFLKLLSDGIILLSIIFFLGYIEIKSLFSILLIIIFFSYFFNLFYLSKLKFMGKLINKNLENIFKNISYALNGYKEFKILSKTMYIEKSFIKSANEIKKQRLRQKLISLLPRHILEIIVITFICLYVIIFQSFNNNLDKIIPVIGAFGIASVRCIPIFNQIISSINNLKFSSNSISNIENFLSYSNADFKINKKQNEFNEIFLENVDFSYQGNDNLILRNINLRIKKGEFIGIIGESGSGKSTFLNLLLGFVIPKTGQIKINNLENLTLLTDFSHLIAYMPQEITLLNENILNNIALDDNISEEKKNEIIKICLNLGLVEKTTEAKDFLSKNVEEHGSNLSGGQRQRIAIARALVHNRKIIILDEVTSALDRSTEENFIDLINTIKKDLTIIMVSHKTNTLRYCNHVFKVDHDGAINKHVL